LCKNAQILDVTAGGTHITHFKLFEKTKLSHNFYLLEYPLFETYVFQYKPQYTM